VIDEAMVGVHMDQTDTGQLVFALISLAENPARTEQMGRSARRVLEEKYSSAQVARRYYDVLSAVVMNESTMKEHAEQTAPATAASQSCD